MNVLYFIYDSLLSSVHETWTRRVDSTVDNPWITPLEYIHYPRLRLGIVSDNFHWRWMLLCGFSRLGESECCLSLKRIAPWRHWLDPYPPIGFCSPVRHRVSRCKKPQLSTSLTKGRSPTQGISAAHYSDISLSKYRLYTTLATNSVIKSLLFLCLWTSRSTGNFPAVSSTDALLLARKLLKITTHNKKKKWNPRSVAFPVHIGHETSRHSEHTAKLLIGLLYMKPKIRPQIMTNINT